MSGDIMAPILDFPLVSLFPAKQEVDIYGNSGN